MCSAADPELGCSDGPAADMGCDTTPTHMGRPLPDVAARPGVCVGTLEYGMVSGEVLEQLKERSHVHSNGGLIVTYQLVRKQESVCVYIHEIILPLMRHTLFCCFKVNDVKQWKAHCQTCQQMHACVLAGCSAFVCTVI